ncbi:substrate-binding domain-containing protein [Amylibacter sp.]|nr:substrate-binding domain-containing protein [Amylibacter sp.]MDA9911473.1 substrate-binding domain-containing protein [Amylibacter sp.]
MKKFRNIFNLLSTFMLMMLAVPVNAQDDAKGLIVSFNGPVREAYIGKFVRGLKDMAGLKGYELSIFENQFNQAQQNQQIQQYLALGELPSAFIWFPTDDVSGLEALQLLAETGVPILKVNQLPNELDKEYIFGFAGPDFSLRGRSAGYMMREAAANKKKSGGSGFNVVVLSYPHDFKGYNLTIEAFNDAILGTDLNIISDVGVGFGRLNGYEGALDLIGDIGNQSIDFVFGMDDAILTGGIKAFEDAGKIMGEDIVAIGAVCNGNRNLFNDGKQYGTTLQSPLHEGQLAIKLVDEYITTGALKKFINFTPNPPISIENIDTSALQGYDGKLYSIKELCTGNW